MDESKKRLFYSRPIDKSLQAFKEWIWSATEAVGGNDTMTEDEWRAAHAEFWGIDHKKPDQT